MWWHTWLRHCATSQKIVGFIPNSVIGIFHWHNPSSRTLVLGLTHSVTEMSTVPGIFPGGRGDQCIGLTTLPPSYAECLEIWEPQTPETLRAYAGLKLDCFTFIAVCEYQSWGSWCIVLHHPVTFCLLGPLSVRPKLCMSLLMKMKNSKQKFL
jgi:hypothetical protein